MEKKRNPYYQTVTLPHIFEEQMKYLKKNNYTVISLEGIENNIQSKKKANNKYVVITFDDGFRDFYTQAFPVLQKYDFSATVFLPTRFIDNKGLKLKEKEHLSWNEVRKLHKNGINFGSHTITHPQLIFLKKEDIEYEIRHSKETIEDKLGESIVSFSYPFAFPGGDKDFKRSLRKILQKFSYKYGVSTRIGITSKNDDIYFMKRIPVNSYDDNYFFKVKLEGGYNWLYALQVAYGFMKWKIKKDHRN